MSSTNTKYIQQYCITRNKIIKKATVYSNVDTRSGKMKKELLQYSSAIIIDLDSLEWKLSNGN